MEFPLPSVALVKQSSVPMTRPTYEPWDSSIQLCGQAVVVTHVRGPPGQMEPTLLLGKSCQTKQGDDGSMAPNVSTHGQRVNGHSINTA